jgi:hypothetical protein
MTDLSLKARKIRLQERGSFVFCKKTKTMWLHSSRKEIAWAKVLLSLFFIFLNNKITT